MNIDKIHETLNTRACKILEIEQHFKSRKIPIDLKYLDSLDDKMLDAIYEMIKRAES